MPNNITNNKYDLAEVIEVVFRKDRFHVKLKLHDGVIKTIPRYIYTWLKYNPAFMGIPKGYVIHHLDHDKTNDDPSNLVIMQKYHHVAYHFKNKLISPRVIVDGVCFDHEEHQPNKIPSVHFHKPANRFYISFGENNGHGKSERRRLWRDDGHPLLTREEAETLRDKLWNNTGRTSD
jgi:hypothetical protein